MFYFFTAGHCPACQTASEIINRIYPVLPAADSKITHLLLPVPSFTPTGSLRGGGDLKSVLRMLPPDITIIGGNLQEYVPPEYTCLDLLQDPFYLAQNAAITAHCAAVEGFQKLPLIPQNCCALVLGWGRIGKSLSLLLKTLGADVTVYARKETDRAAAAGLGLKHSSWEELYLPHYHIIFNTIPFMILPDPPQGPLYIDLASSPGIGGKQVISAKGLPAKCVPESSGKLIARTVLRILSKKEVPQ